MSERRNFPASSKGGGTVDQNVGRGSIDSFAFTLDYLTLKMDDHVRLVKNVPYTLAGIGTVLLLWRSNSLSRLKGIRAVPPRVYRENTKLPVRVVELRPQSVGVVHMPWLWRVFGIGEKYRDTDVMRVKLSGIQFPMPSPKASTSATTLGEQSVMTSSSDAEPAVTAPANSTSERREASAKEYTAPEAIHPPSTAEEESSTYSVPDLQVQQYKHSDKSMEWMEESVRGRTLEMTLLQREDEPFVFLYQRTFPYLRPSFVNLRMVQLGLAESCPIFSQFLIKSDIRKLTAMFLEAEQRAEKQQLGMWKDSRPSGWNRLRSVFRWRRRA